MSREHEVSLRVVIKNRRAIRAMEVVGDVLTELAEEMTWRDDVRKALRAWRYAANHLELAGSTEYEQDQQDMESQQDADDQDGGGDAC